MYIEYSYKSVYPDNSAYPEYVTQDPELTTITQAKLLIVNDLYEILTSANPQMSKFCSGYNVSGDKTLSWSANGSSSGNDSNPIEGNSVMSIISNSESPSYTKLIDISTEADTTAPNAGFPYTDETFTNEDGTTTKIKVYSLPAAASGPNRTAIQLRFILSDDVFGYQGVQTLIDYCAFYACGGTIFIAADATRFLASGISDEIVVGSTIYEPRVSPTIGIVDFVSDDPVYATMDLPSMVSFNAISLEPLYKSTSSTAGANKLYPVALYDTYNGNAIYTPPPQANTTIMTLHYPKYMLSNTISVYNSSLTKIQYAFPIKVNARIYKDSTDPVGVVIWKIVLGGDISARCGIWVLPEDGGAAYTYNYLKYNGKKYVAWPVASTDTASHILVEVR
jgi:hypothetical protein